MLESFRDGEFTLRSAAAAGPQLKHFKSPITTNFAAQSPAWYYGFLTIGIGMTSICCVPFSLPLIIFWIKDETRQFFSASAQ